MKPEALAKLAATGNTRTVEEEWMRLVDSGEASPHVLGSYSPVLLELKESNQRPLGDTLAWAAVETLSANHGPRDLIKAAGPFLLALGDDSELRPQVADLYRKAYADADGLDKLIDEAGLVEGRPVRRALRTLDVCLEIESGSYLLARHENHAARVESIDTEAWKIEITAPGGKTTFGAVRLADEYAYATDESFTVLRQFRADELRRRLDDDPATVVIGLCKDNDHQMDKDQLEKHLVPDLMNDSEWKKWWTKARAALKKHPNVQMERRAPYTVTYTEEEVSAEDEHLTDFSRLHDPWKKWQALDQYLRDCKLRGDDLDAKTLRHCYDSLLKRAESSKKHQATKAGIYLIVARWIGEQSEIENAAQPAVAFLASHKHPVDVLLAVEQDAVLDTALDTYIEARPDSWQDELLKALPRMKPSLCDRASGRLLAAGKSGGEFEPIFDAALAEPKRSLGLLYWLWDGPTVREQLPSRPAITVLSRLLRGLDDTRRDDEFAREKAKELQGAVRNVLAARNLERFSQCLSEIEPAMASALRTQIRRMDETLGRAVREDMLKLLTARFPSLTAKPETPSWAREDILFVTQDGMRRKREEIEHHVNVTMKKNAEAIGRAAARGDLSENSEYKFALEERDLLRARLAQMNSEMDIAKVLKSEDIPSEFVGVGNRVSFRRVSDGAPLTLVFLSPWEADGDQGILNYKAPLAQKIMGSRVSETIEFEFGGQGGEWEIVEIGNAMEEAAEEPAEAR